MNTIINLVEKNLIPDPIVRYGIRKLCKQRLKSIHRNNLEQLFEQSARFLNHCDELNVLAESTQEANEQHYELPCEFFKLVLGNHLKYSCSQFHANNTDLNKAEKETLQLYAQRAQIKNNQRILDLGCGWGSMTLFLATTYPKSTITAISNSHTQKLYIDAQCAQKKINNVNVITCDINDLDFDQSFDRVVSIEMLEHVKNHKALFKKIAKWLQKDGLCFIHIFNHLLASYPFSIENQSDWMAKYFFTGGIMPSNHQFLYYQDHLSIKNHWLMNGLHYKKTANAWLANLDKNKKKILTILHDVYGREDKRWLQRWRIFFMACAELFGYKNGGEWTVSHYLFSPR